MSVTHGPLVKPARRLSGPTWGPTWHRSKTGADGIIERFFSKLKHFRRIATRYDKLAANFLAMVQLASMRLRLRA